MTLDECVAGLADLKSALPWDAMNWALGHWGEAGPRLAALLDAYARGEDRSEATSCALFPAIYMQAEKSDTSAFGPLCRLLLDHEAASIVLSDGITETLSRILVNLYDGDLAALAAVVEHGGGQSDENDEEFIRHGALLAMAYLTRTGRIAHEDMRAHLLRWLDGLQPRSRSAVWEGWALAAAHLGYADLAGKVEGLYRQEFIDPSVMRLQDFRKELHATVEDPARMKGFEQDGTGPFSTAAEELRWVSPADGPASSGSGQGDRKPSPAREPVTMPVTNPLRGVGRNDPCPCGSGRKYKKCCLA